MPPSPRSGFMKAACWGMNNCGILRAELYHISLSNIVSSAKRSSVSLREECLQLSLERQLHVVGEGCHARELQVASGLGSEVGQIDVGFSTIDDRVGVLACSLCRWSILHCDLSVSTALLRLPVSDDNCLLDLAELLKVLVEGLVRCVIGKAADENLGKSSVLRSCAHVRGSGCECSCSSCSLQLGHARASRGTAQTVQRVHLVCCN
ncbi:hypothetical protein PMAYCL1PPCAC_03211, partial [Pristionchus mayeri]